MRTELQGDKNKKYGSYFGNFLGISGPQKILCPTFEILKTS